ncbi:hypothetical protein ACHAXT_003838 [Thalassiosira profunda]
MLWLPALLPLALVEARQSSPIGAFASPPSQRNEGLGHISIERVALHDEEGLAAMSRFCIDAFYNSEDDANNLLSRKWKDIKLAALQKAQLLEISLSSAENRCIFVAKVADGNCDEIVGCCEVIEERLDTQHPGTASERERRKTARPRPVIENMCVKPEHRRTGTGMALVKACGETVRQWLGHDEIFAQVEENNTPALRLFERCGYSVLFADPTCTKVTLDGALFSEETVTKVLMRKLLDGGNEMF